MKKNSRDLTVVAHYIAESCKESGACCNLWMHCAIHVIQQI